MTQYEAQTATRTYVIARGDKFCQVGFNYYSIPLYSHKPGSKILYCSDARWKWTLKFTKISQWCLSWTVNFRPHDSRTVFCHLWRAWITISNKTSSSQVLTFNTLWSNTHSSVNCYTYQPLTSFWSGDRFWVRSHKTFILSLSPLYIYWMSWAIEKRKV